MRRTRITGIICAALIAALTISTFPVAGESHPAQVLAADLAGVAVTPTSGKYTCNISGVNNGVRYAVYVVNGIKKDAADITFDSLEPLIRYVDQRTASGSSVSFSIPDEREIQTAFVSGLGTQLSVAAYLFPSALTGTGYYSDINAKTALTAESKGDVGASWDMLLANLPKSCFVKYSGSGITQVYPVNLTWSAPEGFDSSKDATFKASATVVPGEAHLTGIFAAFTPPALTADVIIGTGTPAADEEKENDDGTIKDPDDMGGEDEKPGEKPDGNDNKPAKETRSIAMPEQKLLLDGAEIPISFKLEYDARTTYTGGPIKPAVLDPKPDMSSLENAVAGKIAGNADGITPDNLFKVGYTPKNNKNASADKPYFYAKITFNTKKAKRAGIKKKKELKSIQSAVGKLNKELKKKKNRCYFIIDPIDLSDTSNAVYVKAKLKNGALAVKKGKLKNIKYVKVMTAAGKTLAIPSKQYSITVLEQASSPFGINVEGKINFKGRRDVVVNALPPSAKASAAGNPQWASALGTDPSAAPIWKSGYGKVQAAENASLELPAAWYNVASRLQTATVTVPEGKTIGLISSTYDVSGRLRESVFKPVDESGDVQVQFSKNALSFNVMAVDKATLAPLCDNILKEREFSAEDYDVRVEEDIELPLLADSLARATGASLHDYIEFSSDLEVMKNMLKLDENGDPVKNADGNPQLADGFDAAKLSTLVEDTRKAVERGIKSMAVMEYAASRQIEKEEDRFDAMEQTDFFYLTDAEKLSWAEQFTKQYDAIKGNMKIQTLAKQMGMDAHDVKDMLDASQAILQSKYTSEAEKALLLEKICIGVKAASKVGLLVGGTIITGGAAGMLTTAEAVGVAIGGVDAAIEVSEATSRIVLGPDNASVDKVFESQTMKNVKGALFVYNLISGGIGFSGAKDYEKLAYMGDLREKLAETLDSFGIEDRDGKLVAKLIEVGYDLSISNPINPTELPESLRELIIGNSSGNAVKDGSGNPVEDWQKIMEELEKNGGEPNEQKLEEIIDEEKGVGSDDTLEEITEEFEEKVKKEKEKEEEPGGGEPEPGGGDPPPPPETVYEPALEWDRIARNSYSKYEVDSKGNIVGLEEQYRLVKKIDDEHAVWRKEREIYRSDDDSQGNYGILWEKSYNVLDETTIPVKIYLDSETYYSGPMGPGQLTIYKSYYPDGHLKSSGTTRANEYGQDPDRLEYREYTDAPHILISSFDSDELTWRNYDEETGEKTSIAKVQDCRMYGGKIEEWDYWPGLTFKTEDNFSWTEEEQHLSEHSTYDTDGKKQTMETYHARSWIDNDLNKRVYGWEIKKYKDGNMLEPNSIEYVIMGTT